MKQAQIDGAVIPNITLKIEVTQAWIDMAAQQTKTRCPVALSLKNLDPNRIQRVIATRDEISFGLADHDVRYIFKTPPKVRGFIDAFDVDRSTVDPITFTLNTATAIERRPIQHPSAKELAQHGEWRAKAAVKPRAHTPRTWSKRVIHAK